MIRSLPVTVCVVFATLIAAMAQPPRAIPVPLGAEPVPAAHRLKPDDTVKLTVFGDPELTTEAGIQQNGEAVFPLIGAVKLAKLTLAEATERIRGMYAADFLRDPKITLAVVARAVATVSVIGEVNAPGPVNIPAGGKIDLALALAAAGNLTPNADRDRITLIRAAGGRAQFREAEIKNKIIPLAAGDRIVVNKNPFIGKTVTILGQVRQPGHVAFPPNGQLDLLTAITNAGDFNGLANKKRVTVTRAGAPTEEIDMRDGNEQVARNFKLRPGDIVNVAERLF